MKEPMSEDVANTNCRAQTCLFGAPREGELELPEAVAGAP